MRWAPIVLLAACAATAAERGRAAAEREDWEAAALAYAEATREAPRDARMWSALGEARYAGEKYGEARAAFEKAAALRPRDARPRIRVGNTFEIERRWEEAEAAYRAATDAAPRDARAWRTLGTRLARWQKLDAAQEALQRAVQVDPRAPQAHHNLALVEAARGDAEAAARAFEGAIAVRPDYRPSLLGLAALRVNAGRHAEALVLYRRVAEADPPSAAAWIAVGLLEKERGDAERAAQALDRAVDLARTDWERSGSPSSAALYARGLALRGERPQALQVVEAGLRRSPNHPELLELSSELGP